MILARSICIALAGLGLAAPAAGALDIHAHRGGTLQAGVPVQPENALPAFQAAAGQGADVLELDVHVSKDGVPFVMHDGSLDRTTDCAGPVSSLTAAELDACHVDILGTTDVFTEVPGSKVPVPRLSALLDWAKAEGARLNVEINNYPDDSGYDPANVEADLNAIEASGIPKKQVLVQSFLPVNLDPAEQRGFQTALITFSAGNANALEMARTNGYDVLEPEWPVANARKYVKDAHASDKTVVPYTLNGKAEILAARAAGVDGVITDDPPLARQAIRCAEATATVRAARIRVRRASDRVQRAKTRAERNRAVARLAAARKKLAKARRAQKSACKPPA